MVKYLIIINFLFLIACGTNNGQIIESEKINFEIIKFNAVSKELVFNNPQKGVEVDQSKKLINDWFNKNIKIDGFDGELIVDVSSIIINKIKKKEYYRFEVNLNIKFILKNHTLSKIKSYSINSLEYADIEGSFSIKDVENLNYNVIVKSLKSINQKISKM